jgi:hypothetical protein
MLTPRDIALILENKIAQLKLNQRVKVTPAKNNKVKPPEFAGIYVGTEKTDIIPFYDYPFPPKIILVAQHIVGKKEPKIVRIPNFLIQDIKLIK